MHSGRVTFAITVCWISVLLSAAPARSQQDAQESYELRGIVVNSVTGQPVPRALVQVTLARMKSQFSGEDGKFAFTGLPRGRCSVTAAKPGYFNEEELGRARAGSRSSLDIPASRPLVLKLAPEGVIYGEVKNENGDPMEGMTVTAQGWLTFSGQKVLQHAGQSTTDDEGHFRIAELLPGIYQLSFQPGRAGRIAAGAAAGPGRTANQGYATQYYPGVMDAESAAAITVRSGVAVHITQSMKRQRLFRVTGIVHGADEENRLFLSVMRPGGTPLPQRVQFVPQSGEFVIAGVPEGTYLLTARAASMPNQVVPLRAAQIIHVNSDLSGVDLTLGQGISVAIQVRDEMPSAGSNAAHQARVRLTSKDFPGFSQFAVAPQAADIPDRPNLRRTGENIENLMPGTYEVEAWPASEGYVASLLCGSVDLLREDLTIAPGPPPPPIEVTLRNDAAELRAIVTADGRPTEGDVIIYSEDYPRRSRVVDVGEDGVFAAEALPPGRYLVVAVEDAQDLEFRNPAIMEKFLRHAVEVNLQPGEKASVQVELQKPREQGP